uniref:Uncharacterized protein n=1 Tax=Arundo donax TaxID=35708 RepID=A0A0A9FNS4_ARUDO
MHFDIPLIVVL